MVHCQRGTLRGRGLIQGVGPVIHTGRRPVPWGAVAIAAAAIGAVSCTLAWVSCRVMNVPKCLTLQTATHVALLAVCCLEEEGTQQRGVKLLNVHLQGCHPLKVACCQHACAYMRLLTCVVWPAVTELIISASFSRRHS
jgi:hypothetical protein